MRLIVKLPHGLINQTAKPRPSPIRRSICRVGRVEKLRYVSPIRPGYPPGYLADTVSPGVTDAIMYQGLCGYSICWGLVEFLQEVVIVFYIGVVYLRPGRHRHLADRAPPPG